MKTPPIRSEITPNLASTCDNVIDVKDQMTFKVLLANRWSHSPEVGGYTSTKIGMRSVEND